MCENEEFSNDFELKFVGKVDNKIQQSLFHIGINEKQYIYLIHEPEW